MALINIAKPTTSLANADKVASFETWATIATTWASETRTWQDMASLMDGFTKASSSITNMAKQA